MVDFDGGAFHRTQQITLDMCRRCCDGSRTDVTLTALHLLRPGRTAPIKRRLTAKVGCYSPATPRISIPRWAAKA